MHWMYPTGSIILNIDERTNIELKTDSTDEFLKGKTYDELRFWDKEEQEYRREFRSYLYISKEDFLKCCHANHLSVRVSIDDSSPTTYEEECDELIPCFQMLYNKTCDDTMFTDNKQKWLTSFGDSLLNKLEIDNEEYERKQVEEKELDKEFSKEKLRIILIIIGAILLGLLPILFAI